MSKSHLKIRTGLNVKGITSYPLDAEEGDLVFRSDLNKYSEYRNGNWASFLDDRYVQVMSSSDGVTTGANATIASTPAPFIRLTNPSLVSIDGITATEDGNTIMLTNATGTVVTIYDETGAIAADRIRTGNAKPIKLKADGTLILIYDGTTARWRVAGGTGGGSGTGDAFAIEETLKNRLLASPFNLLTPYTVLKSEDTLLSTTGVNTTSTATYNIVDDSISFSAAGQTLITENLLDPDEFLAAGLPMMAAELVVFWKPGFIDTGATYELSRNGGNEYQTVAMERVGTTEAYRGYWTFTDELVNQTLQQKSLASDDSNVDLDDGTAREKLAQIFTVTNTELIKNITLKINKIGSPAGYYKVSIVKDNAGSPSTVVSDNLSETNLLPISGLSAGINNVTIDIPDLVLAPGSYHMVIEGDGAYRGSYADGVTEIAVRHDSAGSPVSNAYDGAVWSSSAAGQFVYEVNGIEFDLRVRVTSSMFPVQVDGLGVLYDLTTGINFNSLKNIEIFEFSGDDNETEFTLTKFIPHPDLLKVYDVGTGQVYTYGAFALDGQKVIFEDQQFLNLGETIRLQFVQNEGTAFDNSDVNALLLASNHLGSTDAGIDRSQNGRGIFLRRPDGTLREITVDNTDTIVVLPV